MAVNLIIISVVFMALGLLTGFFARKFINISVFVLLIYVGMITLEQLGMAQSWPVYSELSEYLVGTGRVTIKLFTGILDGAPLVASGLFLAGGVIGLLTKDFTIFSKTGTK